MEFPFAVICRNWVIVLWLKSIFSQIAKNVTVEHVEVGDAFTPAVTAVFYCAPMTRSDAILAYGRGEIRTEVDLT